MKNIDHNFRKKFERILLENGYQKTKGSRYEIGDTVANSYEYYKEIGSGSKVNYHFWNQDDECRLIRSIECGCDVLYVNEDRSIEDMEAICISMSKLLAKHKFKDANATRKDSLRSKILALGVGQTYTVPIMEYGYTTIRSYASDLGFMTGHRYSTTRDREARTYTITREA